MESAVTEIAQSRGNPGLEGDASARSGQLFLEWGKDGRGNCERYLQSLVSLLIDSVDSLVLETDSPENTIEDSDEKDVLTQFREGRISEFRAAGGAAGPGWSARIESADKVSLMLGLSKPEATSTAIHWLQAHPEIPSELPVLGLPVTPESGSIEIAYGLVGLANSGGELKRAEFFDGAGQSERPDAEWIRDDQIDIRLLSTADNAIWYVASREEAGDADGVIGFVDHRASGEAETVQESLLTGLEIQFQSDSRDWDELSATCSRVADVRTPLRIAPLDLAHSPEFRTPMQDDRVLVLKPEANGVVIEVDEDQPSDLAALAVAHGVAHVALGHVRPGDSYGHWDTAETLQNGHRRWDREVRDAFPQWFGTRGIESVEDLDARDKALLGLWRMIHETLGESSKLHPRAEKYQNAAYQRQAAERLLAQLNQFGGAMLCDGVGLGKTYIATTLMVHCANSWQEHRAEKTGEKDKEEPDLFRITVLAPNSVVSTWLREAIPPLYAYGVLPTSVRVISHSKLSRISSSSEVLAPGGRKRLSDLEHLILSDLVIVDEAHNFRSSDARRSLVLRDLLRLQPRSESDRWINRRVLLLTATPVNNSLDDLRQQAALLFSRPVLLSEAATNDGYRRQAIAELKKRAKKARTPSADKGNVAALMVWGDGDANFSKRLEFRDDLDFGTRVQRIGDYLNEQDRKLRDFQEQIRNQALDDDGTEELEETGAIRVADELLDRIVVQRSRALCKAIEREAGSDAEILFRPDASAPEKLHYSDEYDGINDVLAGFLPLFDRSLHEFGDDTPPESGIRPLSLKIYMWYDVREGFREPAEYSPVVGLQRALVLKRLESSPVSLLITLLRLTVFHTFRLQQLVRLCEDIHDREKANQLREEIDGILGAHETEALDKVRSLATGDSTDDPISGFIPELAKSHETLRPAADTDDSPVQQLTLDLFSVGEEDEEAQLQREQIERLWDLRGDLLQDFDTLLTVTPELADIVFGKFERSEWPRKFIAGGLEVDWPESATWGQRIVSDAKIRRLVARLLEARRSGQKAIVFSQFSDSLAYIRSVLRACRDFTRKDWSILVAALGVPNLHAEEVEDLLAVTEVITGETEDRDATVNAFAPYYRIGPFPPSVEGVSPAEADSAVEEWKSAWRSALDHPIDVLLATDILAEGVNLQDAALLINFDIHWNPVRMIQRSGRIDRRLNPRIEHLEAMPEVEALAAEVGKEVPNYYWHDKPDEAPLTVNMILPDELERELLLRERIAIKTLAIDFTLGLDQGTGAEADWMDKYRYQGISSLNAFDKDRAIEQIAGYHEKLGHDFARRGIDRDWSKALNIWVRQNDVGEGAPLVARAAIGQRNSEIPAKLYTRYLEPALLEDGTPCWLWAEEKPRVDSLLNHWLVLDSKTYPPRIEKGLPITETSSSPITAHHLLAAVRGIEGGVVEIREVPTAEIGRPLRQGISAVSAGFFDEDSHRRNLRVENFFVLQLGAFDDRALSA